MKYENNASNRQIALWLLVGVGMTVIQIALGGITRLTGSGLSITEWNVITGTLPPLNEQAWLIEFEKYKQTPQFALLNFDFTLSEFKYIFFWEWFHRLWARLIGFVFLGGFVYFIAAKKFKPNLIKPLLILFLLGALQGGIGWIMVKSGLTGDAVYVKPTRLAMHFVLALLLLAYTFWFALRLLVPAANKQNHRSLRKWNQWLLGLLFLQLIYGALMAGHKAANVAPTWPKINGEWIPANLAKDHPFLLNFIDNTILIHFIHRGLAYLILAGVIIWSMQLFKTNGSPLFNAVKKWPLIVTVVQVILGVASVLSSSGIVAGSWGVFEWMAQSHQLVGMLLLLTLCFTLFLLQPANTKE